MESEEEEDHSGSQIQSEPGEDSGSEKSSIGHFRFDPAKFKQNFHQRLKESEELWKLFKWVSNRQSEMKWKDKNVSSFKPV